MQNINNKLNKLQNCHQLRELHHYQSIKSGNKRFLIDNNGQKFISFASNDYFSLANNRYIINAAIKAINQYGVGAVSSRLISGNNILYQDLENLIAKIKKTEASLVFSSGYATAISVIPALFDKNDLIIADKLIHSCLIDGIKLSGAKMIRFIHNDISDCDKILQNNRHLFKKSVIISESVFSMDGDLGKVKNLAELAKKYNSSLLIDDAHGLGIVNLENIDNYFTEEDDNFFLQMGTLSKAVAAIGGYVAGKNVVINYLKNFAKSLIYSTALPPAVLASSIIALQLIENHDFYQKIIKKAQYFCNLLNLNPPSSPIIPIIIGDNEKTMQIATSLKEQGFLVGAIRPPTVAINSSRLRITINLNHSKQDIKNLATAIKKLHNF